MVGQTRAMLEATPPDGRYRETVIDHSNMYHRSFGHVPIHTAIHPCGKGSNIRLRGLHLTGVDLRPTPQNPQVRPGSGSAAPTLAAGR